MEAGRFVLVTNIDCGVTRLPTLDDFLLSGLYSDRDDSDNSAFQQCRGLRRKTAADLSSVSQLPEERFIF